jgi:hypothetical protein
MSDSQTILVENKSNVTLTDNGMVTNNTTLNKCVDLFFSIGSMRGKSKDKVVRVFEEAFNENPLVASKVLFWARDVRGGSGERKVFRDVISSLITNSPQTVRKNIALIPEFGRWDDVLVLFGTVVSKAAICYFIGVGRFNACICCPLVFNFFLNIILIIIIIV